MSNIRLDNWYHQSGTGGIYQDSSGNVGIGSSVPAAKLDVNGDIKSSGGFNLGISSGGTSVTNGNPITEINFVSNTTPTLNGTIVNVSSSSILSSIGSSISLSGISTNIDTSSISSRVFNITIRQLSVSNDTPLLLRLETGGSSVDTGYTSYIDDSGSNPVTNAFQLSRANLRNAETNFTGIYSLINFYDNVWLINGTAVEDNAADAALSGRIDLGGSLTGIGLTLATGSFDNGTMTISYLN